MSSLYVRNPFGRENPYTGYWMNSNPCPGCLRDLRKNGKHRAHAHCSSQTMYQYIAVICDCECRAFTTRFLMSLNELEDD